MSRKMREPWERLPKESDPAWEAFVTYRDMPEETGLKRSITRLERKLHKSRAVLGGWSSKYNWVKRCAAYDSYRDDLEIQERIKSQKKRIRDVEEMDQRHVSLSIQLQRQVFARIREVTETGETLDSREIESLTRSLRNLTEIEQAGMHTTGADRQLELSREEFEYRKEQDAGANVEYEDLSEAEDSIYGEEEKKDAGQPNNE